MRPAHRKVSLLLALRGAVALRPLSTATLPVAQRYTPLRKDPSLFEPSLVASTWLDPRFVALADALAAGEDARALVTKEAREIYSFPLLCDEVCDRLCDEVEHFSKSGLPARRPNSMNRYGLILNEIGLRPSLDALQATVAPVARALWRVEGAALDNHHSFCVSYKPDEDRGLDMHTDDSDVTLNVCLGRNFTAAGLTFCGDTGAQDHRQVSWRYQHQLGVALMHLGRRRHGADDISEGHRLNLIMWNYNKRYRASEAYRTRTYAREPGPPDPLCVSYTHDRDWEAVRGEARPEVRFATTAWCPPPQAEYEGFGGVAGRYSKVDPMHRELPLN